jgi:hypothetical protein
MYLEFLLLFIDYIKTVNKRIFIYEIVFPLIIGLAVFFLLRTGHQVSSCAGFRDSSLTLLGVLAGFSITIITILTTSQSKNIDAIKLNITDFKIGGKKISLFRLLLVNFTYSVVLEIILIIINLLAPLIIDNFNVSLNIKIIGFSIVVFFIIHILLLTIRNLTDFYMIISK